MGMAPVAHVVFNKFMTFNPKNPKWVNRDRFVLSYVLFCTFHTNNGSYDGHIKQARIAQQFWSNSVEKLRISAVAADKRASLLLLRSFSEFNRDFFFHLTPYRTRPNN